MKKAALHNLGCKVNSYETEVMQEMLEKQGYEIVSFDEKADVYLINTCSVTNMADRKSRQMLHRAKKQNPDALVIAAGCYVQSAGEALLADASVDILIGNNEKAGLPEILKEWEKSRTASHIHSMTHEKQYEDMSLEKASAHTRACMKIQDGCDQFCTYCIIPYTRGRVRSRSLADVVAEAGRLAANGCQEVVLTGIHLDSYGTDLSEGSLLSVIRAVAEVDGIQRIRLGSLEPRIITEEFLQGLSEMPKVCPHFHLSLQSGCNATLRRMNRRYTAEEYREKCALLRKYFHNPALTTDVIVGFPGETEEEFEESRAFIDETDFYETHIFKYSKREGTKAAVMEGQVPEAIKAERSNVLLELGRKKQTAYEEMLIGTVQEVLIEEAIEMKDGIYQVGHTREYVKIGQKTKENLTNQLINVEIKNPFQIIH